MCKYYSIKALVYVKIPRLIIKDIVKKPFGSCRRIKVDLGAIRSQIDEIDQQLVDLFEKRMKLTGEVAEYKIQTGKSIGPREGEAET